MVYFITNAKVLVKYSPGFSAEFNLKKIMNTYFLEQAKF